MAWLAVFGKTISQAGMCGHIHYEEKGCVATFDTGSVGFGFIGYNARALVG